MEKKSRKDIGSGMSKVSDGTYLALSDVLRFFNNPIKEEQAWAVCYQCAQSCRRQPSELSQVKYRLLCQHGSTSVCFCRDGEVEIRSDRPGGSDHGKLEEDYNSSKKSKKHLASECEALQALGQILFEALDYGIGEMEERPLSPGLETLIHILMSCGEEGEGTDTENQSADDEGIEKDAGEEPHTSFKDVIEMCAQRLTVRQDAQHHYRAVCRALVAEAVELHTFLDVFVHSREKLQQNGDNQDNGLLELQRADWALLWMQVMRSLRQGVRLKKVEATGDPTPVEYELTPFEMLLDDIRSRRYTLHKIMANGDLPPRVKKDAHAIILDFIRSRPPLRRVKDRKLRALPPKPPDARERLLLDIRARPTLNPVRHLLEAKTSLHTLSRADNPSRARKLIKPDFSLLLSNSFEDSDEDSEGDGPQKVGRQSSPLRCSPLTSPVRDDMNATWHSGLVGSGHEGRGPRLQRRHTITVCESPIEGKLAALQELPPVEEEEEPSPTEDQTPRFQYGSDSPLSGLPDHTLHNGHSLLRGVARPMYRSEHRRSLTTGLTAIPEDEDATDCFGGGQGGPFVRRERRHSMPAVPQRLSPRQAGSRPGAHPGFYAADCHSHFLLDTEKPGHWCRMRGARSPILEPRREACRGGEGEGEGRDLALLKATENMHKRWQNPIECLSLTLEEVTHIRSVLTKAELESLVSHPDLYNQVSKNKVCFTCKTTRFSLFGEWGSRCKFCKRTVCSKCMRKIYMPTEQLKDVPVYTLSSTPLSQETLALVHNYVQTNAMRRSSSPNVSPRFPSDQPRGKHFLQRSHSLIVPGNTGSEAKRGPMTSICCDCKAMVMEILRACKSSLDILLPILQSAGTNAVLSDCSSSPTSSSASTSTSSSC